MPRLVREPTLLLQVVSAALGLAVALGVFGLNGEQAALLLAVTSAVLGAVNAAVTRPVTPAAFTALVAAVAAASAGFGFEASAQTVGAVQALVVSVLALQTRAQVTPAADPRPAQDVVG